MDVDIGGDECLNVKWCRISLDVDCFFREEGCFGWGVFWERLCRVSLREEVDSVCVFVVL